MGMTIATLSFMSGGAWAPKRSGSYEYDCRVGREAAAELLDAIETEENPAMFGSVVRAMVAAGTYEGVEIGFCSAIGIHLIGLAPVSA